MQQRSAAMWAKIFRCLASYGLKPEDVTLRELIQMLDSERGLTEADVMQAARALPATLSEAEIATRWREYCARAR